MAGESTYWPDNRSEAGDLRQSRLVSVLIGVLLESPTGADIPSTSAPEKLRRSPDQRATRGASDFSDEISENLETGAAGPSDNGLMLGRLTFPPPRHTICMTEWRIVEGENTRLGFRRGVDAKEDQ